MQGLQTIRTQSLSNLHFHRRSALCASNVVGWRRVAAFNCLEVDDVTAGAVFIEEFGTHGW
jgi:hypothetical protein